MSRIWRNLRFGRHLSRARKWVVLLVMRSGGVSAVGFAVGWGREKEAGSWERTSWGIVSIDAGCECRGWGVLGLDVRDGFDGSSSPMSRSISSSFLGCPEGSGGWCCGAVPPSRSKSISSMFLVAAGPKYPVPLTGGPRIDFDESSPSYFTTAANLQ